MANFEEVSSLEQLDRLFDASFQRPVVLFKHSSTCGISAHIIDMVGAIDADVNLIVVQDHRAISNEVERRTGRRHQSPQAFVIKNGEPVYHASHYAIDPLELERQYKA